MKLQLIYGVLVVMTAMAGCAGTPTPAGSGGPRIVQPGAPGEESRVGSLADGPGILAPRYAPADVRFMQAMIEHHQQAIDMASLVAGRTARGDVRLMAMRIDLSQKDEMALMRNWLERRGEAQPSEGVHSIPGRGPADAMPHGMLNEREMAELAGSSGAEFDRLFLTYMIRHHAGALEMVDELFQASGGQETEVFQFATAVASDQPIEMARMRRMLVGAR